MTSAEFWDTTPDEFDARVEVFHQLQKREDIRFGTIAAAYINTKLKKGAQPVKPGAFFGHKEEADTQEMTPAQTIAAVRSMTDPEIIKANALAATERERIQQ